jgi:CrcB protein
VNRAPLAARDEVAAVAVGGVIGALARAAVSYAVPHEPSAWPWATFAVNLLGCLALGLVLAWVDARHGLWSQERPRRARLARPFLASGVLGGFTTFSTFSVEAVRLIETGHAASAVGYALSSAVLGVLLVLVGRALGAAVVGPSPVSLREDEEL